jgi:probable sporulation protein (polysaccharide deacetylase family)
MFGWLLVVFPLLLAVVQSPAVTAYVDTVKEGALPAFAKGDLRSEIESEAKRRYEPPVDARIDGVWKAVPGYDGLAVDVEETYRLAKKQKSGSPIPWVYKVVPARVSLDDLEPQPIYRGNERKPMVALMVNVSWGTEYLPGMLQVLRQERVPATFFLEGSWVKKNPEQARALVKEGHEIGNHAYSHPQMSSLSSARIREEILRTEQLIEETLGTRSKWFAPPAGDFNQTVVKEADRLGMKTVLWTVDTVDWRKSSTPELMVERVKRGITGGSLILMHPTDRTVEALPEIIRIIKEKGLRLGTVSEVLSPKRLEPVEPMVSF